MENVLKIRIEFEEAVEEIKKGSSEIKKTVAGAFQDGWKEAKKGGDAFLEATKSLGAAIRGFDLAHPFQSMAEIGKASIGMIISRLGVLGKVVSAVGALFLGVFASMRNEQELLVNTFSQLSAYTGRLRGDVDALGESVRMSMGERVSAAFRDISDVSFKTMASLREVTEAYSQLALTRVPMQDLKELTDLSILAGRAMGISSDRTAQFIGHLRVIGGAGVEDIKDVVKTFSAVQDVVGLTNAELTNVMDTVEQLTLQIKGLGATSQGIANLATETAKLAGMFGELGLSAQRGSEMMAKLMDPGRTKENLFLMQKMGMSFQEFQQMQAGMMDEGQVTEGMIRASKEFTRMTEGMLPIQKARIADMFGMSMNEMHRLAKEGDQILAEQRKRQEDGTADLEKRAAEGMATLNKSFSRLLNVIQATFAVPLAGIMETVTDKLADISEWWINNADEIKTGFNEAVQSFIGFVKKIDFQQVKQFFLDMAKNAKTLWERLQLIGKILMYVAAGFAGIMVLKTVVPLIVIASKALGALAIKLGIFKAAAVGSAAAGPAMAGAFAFLLKGAGLAIVMIGFGIALEKLAGAFVIFNDVEWSGLAKAGVAIAGLVAGLALFSAFVAGPQIVAIAAATIILMGFGKAVELLGRGLKDMGEGIAAFEGSIGGVFKSIKDFAFAANDLRKSAADLSPVMQDFAAAIEPLGAVAQRVGPDIESMSIGIKNIVEGINILDASKITSLSESVDENTVKAFQDLGLAIGGLAGGLRGMNPKRTEAMGVAIKGIGEGMKDLAIGAWVLGQIDDMEKTIDGLAKIMESAIPSMYGHVGDMEAVGKGFSFMAEGITTLTELHTGKIHALGTAMEASSKGLGEWMKAFKKGGTILKDMEATGKGFKELAIGIWVLGETDFTDMADQMKDFLPVLIRMLDTINRNSRISSNVKSLTDSFESLAKTVSDFSSIDSTRLWHVTRALDATAAVVMAMGASTSLFKDTSVVAESFKELAEGIISLAMAADAAPGGFKNLGTDLTAMQSGLSKVLASMKESGGAKFLGLEFGKSMDGVGETFKELAEGVIPMAIHGDSIASGFGHVAGGIGKIGEALELYQKAFSGRNSTADQFIRFIKDVQSAGPVKIDAESMTSNTVKTKVETEGLNEVTSLTINLQASIAQASSQVVAAINMFSAEEQRRHEERLGMLTSISTNTKRTKQAIMERM